MTPAQVRRREAAIDQALRDLATGDYESIQMREIAEGAGIALATLYRYFPSKEYLFAVALERWVDRIRSEVGAAARHGTAQPLSGSGPSCIGEWIWSPRFPTGSP
jgi:AcrR family transcriptional regulator